MANARKLHQLALRALKEAVSEAIKSRTSEGLPVYVWKDDKVVDLNAVEKKSSRRRTTATAALRKKSR